MMQARTQNPAQMVKRMAATAVMAMALTAPAAHADPGLLGGPTLPMRTLMQYDEGSWMAPAAVLLTSPEAWTAWNAEQVASGMAVAAESVPADVNWQREVVLVVTTGMLDMPASVELTGAHRSPRGARVNLTVSLGRGGYAPCHVVALDRRSARNVEMLANLTVPGMPASAETYTAAGSLALDASTGGTLPVPTSWGALKADYR